MKSQYNKAIAAGTGTLCMTATAYIGAKYGWGDETIAAVAGMLGIVTTLGVSYLRNYYPDLVNVAERVTGTDLDKDGDVGE